MGDQELRMWCIDHAVKFCDTQREVLQFSADLFDFARGSTIGCVAACYDAAKDEPFVLSDETFEEAFAVSIEPTKTVADRAAKPVPKHLDPSEDPKQKAHALPQLGTLLFDILVAIRSILREGGKPNSREIAKKVKIKQPEVADLNISRYCSNLRQKGFLSLETGHPSGNQWVLTQSCLKHLEAIDG